MSNTITPNYMSFSGAFRSLSRSNDLSSKEQSEVKGTIITVVATINYNEIGAGLNQSQTTTVPGASPGDLVLLGPIDFPTGYTVSAFVPSPNLVTVRIANNTAGPLTPGALVFSIAVVKP